MPKKPKTKFHDLNFVVSAQRCPMEFTEYIPIKVGIDKDYFMGLTLDDSMELIGNLCHHLHHCIEDGFKTQDIDDFKEELNIQANIAEGL